MSSIFLSYTENDKKFASRLTNDLNLAGFSVIKDCIRESDAPNQSFLERMLASGKRINHILLLYSKYSAVESTAYHDWENPIIDNILHGRNWITTIILEKCTLHPYISSAMLEDFSNQLKYSSSFSKLLIKLKDTNNDNC